MDILGSYRAICRDNVDCFVDAPLAGTGKCGGNHTSGYPIYVCSILGTAKFLGSIAILQNRYRTIKEWAYAGYMFNLLGAAASHALTGDSFGKIIAPVIVLCLVVGSYRLWRNAPRMT